MKKSILLYEDNDRDVILIKHHLNALPYKVDLFHVKNRAEFAKTLYEIKIDLILSDYNVPDFSGLDALQYTFQHYPYIPFVFVTGTVNNEELAAETILRGASGYVLKNNLNRLVEVLINLLALSAGRTERMARVFNQIRNNHETLDRLGEYLNRLDRLNETWEEFGSENPEEKQH